MMWTDTIISEQLLYIHVDSSSHLAGRSSEKTSYIVKQINHLLNKSNIKLLDLGCVPGLFTEKFTQSGHQVTGIDFSEMSIAHAKTISGKFQN